MLAAVRRSCALWLANQAEAASEGLLPSGVANQARGRVKLWPWAQLPSQKPGSISIDGNPANGRRAGGISDAYPACKSGPDQTSEVTVKPMDPI